VSVVLRMNVAELHWRDKQTIACNT